MKVKEIMTKKVITVKPEDSFLKVAKIIFEKKIGGLPVVDKKGNLLGIISEKDLLTTLFPSMADLIYHPRMKNWSYIIKKAQRASKLKVRNLMKKNVITTNEETSLVEAISQMILSRIHRLPVLNKKGRLSGIITRGDVFTKLLEEIKD